jgi:hypothetical protein
MESVIFVIAEVRIVANQAPDKEKLTPPYISFVTFRSFIEQMKNTTIPPRIDNSVTTTMSGQARGALLSCFRFLKLIEQESTNVVSENIDPLVEAFGTEGWEQALATVIHNSPYRVIDGINITRATGGQLLDAFRQFGVDGQVLEKAVRFYLAALEDAKIQYSPLFKTRGATTVRKSGTSKAKARKEKQIDPIDDEFTGSPAPLAVDGLVPFVVPFPDKAAAKFYLPKNITEDDWTMIDTIGRAYVKRTATKAV